MTATLQIPDRSYPAFDNISHSPVYYCLKFIQKHFPLPLSHTILNVNLYGLFILGIDIKYMLFSILYGHRHSKS